MKRPARAALVAVAALVIGLAVAPPVYATDYHVGPGQSLTKIGDVPWYRLQPGDTVYIHYQPTPYYEKFLISSRGTPTQWIRVLGVPGPNGELPIISGNNATTSSNMHYHWQQPDLVQWDGVVQIAVRADDATGYAPLPGYIEVAGLQIQDGYKDYKFTAENGTSLNYEGFAACVYARTAQHIIIRNSVMTNCGQGFYDWTGDGSSNTWWAGLTADVVLRENYFYNNGNPNSYTEHQTYTESNGVTIEGNHYGPQRTGAMGSQLKDRSAGSVVRYNFIEQSAQGWDLDLVEPQESWPSLGSLPTYAQTFVYGNILMNRTNGNPDMIHWNEDHEAGQGRATIAGSKLLFYDNTVVTVANLADMGYGGAFVVFNTTWGGFECSPNSTPGVIDVRNNVFAVIPRTAGSPVPTIKWAYCNTTNLAFGTNWVSPGSTPNTAASVSGLQNLVSPSGNNVGFTNVASNDFHLATGSSAIGIAGALPSQATTNALGLDLTPNQQYVYQTQLTARPSSGTGSDVGGFASGTAGTAPKAPAAPTNLHISTN